MRDYTCPCRTGNGVRWGEKVGKDITCALCMGAGEVTAQRVEDWNAMPTTFTKFDIDRLERAG